jgi:hypothetical protein
MTVVQVWVLLVAISAADFGENLIKVGTYPSIEACQHVQRNIPSQNGNMTRVSKPISKCIQSTIVLSEK